MKVMSEERINYIAGALDSEPANAPEAVEFRDPIKELGFARMEHIVGLDTALSDGAYRTLAILHYFWQRKDAAWPSLQKLADMRGKSVPAIKRHLAELKEKKIISRERRFDDSSITYLEDLPREYENAAREILQKRATNRSKTIPHTAQKRSHCGIKNEPLKRTIEVESLKDSGETKNVSLPSEDKPKTKSPAAQKAIEMAGAALQEWEKKTDAERERDNAIADPRKAKQAFVKEYAPLMAKVFSRAYPISEDRGAVGDIFNFHCDRDWLTERLTAYANGAGDEYRRPTKDGKKPVAYWVRDRIEREWAECRQERDNAKQRAEKQADYERRLAAALAGVPEAEYSSGRARPESVHLHDPLRGPGGDGDGDKLGQTGIAVDAGRELQMRGDGLDLCDVPGRSVDTGTAGGISAVQGHAQSVRELFRTELQHRNKLRRHLSAVDGEIPQSKERDASG